MGSMTEQPQTTFRCILVVMLSVWLCISLSSELHGESRRFTRQDKPAIIEGRGKWSVTADDELVDLTGDWQVVKPSGFDSDTIKLPFCWEGEPEKFVLRKTLNLHRDLWDRRWRLVVDGFAQNLAVTLNGFHIDTRSGDGISFQIDLVPGVLRFGAAENELILTMDNRLSRSKEVPLKGGIYARKRYGGLFHNIYLIGSPPVSISDLSAKFIGDHLAPDTIRVIAEIKRQDHPQVDRDNDPYKCQFSILDDAGSEVYQLEPVVVNFNSVGIATVRRLILLPNLSDAICRLQCKLIGNQTHTASLTIRKPTIRFTPQGFRIGSNERQLRGVTYCEPDSRSGVVGTVEQVESDIIQMKELGVDVVRVVQGPTSQHFLNLCEQYGLGVLQELPLFHAPDRVLSEPDLIRSASAQLEAMINRDKMFNCIIGWGIGSRINPPNNENYKFYQMLVQKLKELDDRPVYATIPFTDQITAAPLDFVVMELSPNNFWRDKPLPQTVDCDKPILLGGVQQMVIPGNLGGWSDPTSEAGQAHYLLERLEQVKDKKWCNAVFVSDFADWLGAVSTVTCQAQSSDNQYQTGLMDSARQPRLAFWHLAEYWASGTVLPLNRGDDKSESMALFIVVGIGLVGVLLVFIRQNHLFKLNLIRTFSSPRIFFQDIGEKRYFQSGSTVMISLLISGGLALIATSWLLINRTIYPFDWVVGYLFGDSLLHGFIGQILWQPVRALLVVWGATIVLIWMGTIRATILSRLIGRSFSMIQSFYFINWSFAVCLALLPVGLFAHRLYLFGGGWIATTLTVAALIWSHYRLFVVLHQNLRCSILKVFSYWMVGPFIVAAIIFGYLERSHHLSYYWQFFWGTIL